MLSKIIYNENYFPKAFAKSVVKDEYTLFYNLDIRRDYTANHVVFNDVPTDEAINEVTDFFISNEIQPCVVSNFNEKDFPTIKEKLQQHGYVIEELEKLKYIYFSQKDKEKELYFPENLTIKEVKMITKFMINSIFEQSQTEVIYRSLTSAIKKDNFHLYVGYYQNLPMASIGLNIDQNIIKVEYISINKKYRNKGYYKELVDYALREFRRSQASIIYFASNEDYYIRIFQKAGFYSLGHTFEKWVARIKSPFIYCPRLKNNRIRIRQLRLDDADKLLSCYQQQGKAPTYFNLDFSNETIPCQNKEQVKNLLKFYLSQSKSKKSVYWTVIDLFNNNSIGVISITPLEKNEDYKNVGLLRMDIKSEYETKEIISAILNMTEQLYELFDLNTIISKAWLTSRHRINAMLENGFKESFDRYLIKKDGYFFKVISPRDNLD